MKGTHLVMMSLAAVAAMSGCSKAPKGQIASFTAEDMDLTVDPATDFYQYANGGWIKQHPLPDDKSRFGAFDLLAEENRDKLKALVEEVAAKKGEEGTVDQKIGDLYAAGLDTIQRDIAGYEPLKPYLLKIQNITDKSQLASLIAEFHAANIAPLFYFSASADMKNSDWTIADTWQVGLGMPDRDYYFEDGERSENIRKEYNNLLNALFVLAGNDSTSAAQKAKDAYDIEVKLAEVSNTRIENRNPYNVYNKTDLEGLKKIAPNFDWDQYFKTIGVEIKEINISQPKFMTGLSDMILTTDIERIKNYLEADLLISSASFLSSDFIDANFKFYGQTLSGVKEMQPLWKRVLNTINANLGEAIGQIYVEKYFPATSKARMLELVENLRIAFGQRIDALTWMDDSTKQAAHEKLNAITVKIGYPDKWKDYSSLKIVKGNFFENLMEAGRFEFAETIKKIGKPVDKLEWYMTPQTVNAYYNPSANEIVFPAGILQPPFFFADGDDAVNYGAIGVVIGHEMTHGFDDEGRKFDKNGNMNEWWKDADAERFQHITQRLVDRYNSFTVIDTLKANGQLTLGENIADNGGLNISYQAYCNSQKDKEAVAPIDGFTAEQRFLLAYARVWASNIRDEEIYRLTKTDPHSLARYRVNGQVPMFDLFYKAFNVPEGAPMYLPEAERIVVW